MFRRPTLTTALIVIAAVSLPNLPTAEGTQRSGLPLGFKVLRSMDASANQISGISRKLGGRIDKLSNISLSVHGSPLQLNKIICPTSADTAQIYKSILARKGHPAFCYTFENTVVEFVGNDTAVAIVAGFEFGYKPKPTSATYKISFQAAPMDGGDYMSWNKLFNLFLEANRDPGNAAFKARIGMLSDQFRFGDEITLRTMGSPQTRAVYSFKPAPTEAMRLPDGDFTRYKFQDLPEKLGVRCIDITATVHTAATSGFVTGRQPGAELLGPTEFWPSDFPEIVSLAKRITARCDTQQEKIVALLKWLAPGANIRFAGPVIGSRHGVRNTLAQKFGYCWDFSDCFITFCRALKIPSRQVAGWLYGQGGHIWAEVLYEDNKWWQVDPTGGGVVGCGIYHIPYITSEDGKMPILYLSQPQIEFLNY